MTVEELCQQHRRLALDANVLIYLVEGHDPWGPVARDVLKAVEDGRTSAVLSAVGLAEVLSGPARSDPAQVERYDDDIRSISGLKVIPVAAEIAVDSSVIRGARRIALADAIHLATARRSGATAFVTNDRSLRGSPRLQVIYLDELKP